ncbi:MAG: tRNA pseudouridine(38-40) synthase TruA [Peptococcaceae bacterium]|nr:tRNA pseudouridine(38-40) synthase TruA [Peptococcaceae bacterium]
MVIIKVTIEYDGTCYHGFQEQRGTEYQTVQGVLEDCASRLAKSPIRIAGAGRTDAGVHARGQVISFPANSWPVPLERTVYALNSLLPDDIKAVEAVAKPEGFHARFSAVAKTYRYTIYNGKWPSPLLRLYSYHVPHSLDLDNMRKAAAALTGEHDFSAFRALGTPVKTTVRMMHQIRVSESGGFVHISMRANGFLYHMARLLAGTMLRVGIGKLPAADIAGILASGDSLLSGPALPARGLCLEEVEYK